ncbi:hypothetical protein ACWGJ9_10735 [Curtobacterium citreum]
MSLSPDGTSPQPHLPTRRELRAAERLREAAARDAEEAAKQQFISEYEAARLNNADPADGFNDPGYGFDDTPAFAHPAASKSSAFYASGSPDGMFDDAPVTPVTLEPEKPAPVVQTTVNYLAIGGVAAALAATAATFISAAAIAALPLGVLAIILAFIGLAKRRGSIAVPAVALLLALGAASWAGWQQFHPADEPAAMTSATTLTVTSTGGNVNVKTVRIGDTTTTPGETTAPFTTSGTGDAAVTASPAASGDTLTCTITKTGTAPTHQQGQPGQPVTCSTQPTEQDTP